VATKTERSTPPAGGTALHDRLDTLPPTSVKLADGDVFVGTFDHLERGETSYGPCLVAVFDAPDVSGMLEPPEIPDGGRASLWLFHEALLSRMKRLRPAKGDRLGVKRIGKATSGNDRSFVNYSVASERDDAGEVTWDQVAPVTVDSGQFNDEPGW
jgi:hypothetical protein